MPISKITLHLPHPDNYTTYWRGKWISVEHDRGSYCTFVDDNEIPAKVYIHDDIQIPLARIYHSDVVIMEVLHADFDGEV